MERARSDHEDEKVTKYTERERQEQAVAARAVDAAGAVAGAHIGTLNEKPLHAALKNWYGRPGDRFEVRVDGFFIDIVRSRDGHEDLLVEIQTRSLAKLKQKLTRLAETHPVRLVYPVGQEKWIVRMERDGSVVGRRRSPKRGGLEMVFAELVSFPKLLQNPGFTLEVLLIREEEVRVRDETLNWRRKGWATSERRLLEVVSSRVFEQPGDLLELVPASLPNPFTPVQLAHALGRPAWLARRMTYCLREMGVLEQAGKKGRSNLFARPAQGRPADARFQTSEGEFTWIS